MGPEPAVAGNTARLDRLEVEVRAGFERMDERFEEMGGRFDRLESVVTAGFAGHEERIRALEG